MHFENTHFLSQKNVNMGAL